ncbi:hypothetical protein DCAR_0102277 [Daucus carota subsp. sativus]|uniref:Uncharacterized protein n=2 Tax=Daucus carota subsp. sativus TaxID=79200 RepID=A0AAF0W7J1_DAUCS|nr:PREDICTED: uncharacterized protein LOC108197389 [Daucus carota subsp. sativus]WOG83103.1 hypothetical protein DCAR_0102277 [Daucus carota subsp. sativus]
MLELLGSKRVRVGGDEEDSSAVNRHSRPKKLVPARRLGLKNRQQVRCSQQVVHSSSSGDEYEDNPETGERRKRVGFLFRTAPRPLLPNLLTKDDQWKLEGCSVQKRGRRAERAAGLVLGEFAGLLDSLATERSRCSRLQKRGRGLEQDLERAKARITDAVVAEQVTTLQATVDGSAGRLAELSKEGELMKAGMVSLQEANASLGEKLTLSEVARSEYEGVAKSLGKENDELRAKLAAVPSKEAVIAEYRESDVFKRAIVDARVARVEAYRGSEDFDSEMKSAVKRGVAVFKDSAEYADEMQRVRESAVDNYRSSIAFKQAVGAEAGKMSRQVVECCREFLKDDLQRPTQDFGGFFVAHVRRQRDGAPNAGGDASVSDK